MHLIEVAFKGNRKEFFVFDGDEPPKTKAAVIVEVDRGEDFGRVYSIGELAEQRAAGVPHGTGGQTPQRKLIRLATTDEEQRAVELALLDDGARRKAMERVKAHGLVMKVSDAEWQWDRKKLTFFFTADKRVDFRALVRDLASAFRTRIELKQIGVRDEAKRLDGIGRCGRQYCSASWLPELRPVNLQVAKDQRLSLNPSQISGACGRLMCCLRYEHDFYAQARKRFPKEGRILVTAKGEEKVVYNDIFNDRVTMRAADGESRFVPLAELKVELAAVAERPPDTDDPGADVDAPNDEAGGEEMAVDAEIVAQPQGQEPPTPAAPSARVASEPLGTDDDAQADRDPRAPRRRGRRGGRRNRRPGDTRPESPHSGAGDDTPPTAGGDA
ncbi:MAG: regulatory iron-sulfur-containing complex subunit RicT [Gemmatimonadaceae bacterium]